MNLLIREIASFHSFKGLSLPELLTSVLFAAADLFSVLLFVKFMREVPMFSFTSHQQDESFSPALSLITDLDSPSESSNGVEHHLQLQYEQDCAEQNVQDCEAYRDFLLGSGYNGQFWDELDGSP